MLRSFESEISKINEQKKVNPLFIDTAVDFIRIYADRLHHGKEEDILFRDLMKKKLSQEHARIIDELMEDHRYARKTTGMLVDAKERYLKGENTVEEVITLMKELARFYPVHIEKEDKHFFFPCQEYFSKEELDKMLAEFYEFDRKMIHEKYEKIVNRMETQSL
ncbi:MAG: cation-binding protein [Smithella sp.]|nr:cation-binding protein [Smithella sp.]